MVNNKESDELFCLVLALYLNGSLKQKWMDSGKERDWSKGTNLFSFKQCHVFINTLDSETE